MDLKQLIVVVGGERVGELEGDWYAGSSREIYSVNAFNLLVKDDLCKIHIHYLKMNKKNSFSFRNTNAFCSQTTSSYVNDVDLCLNDLNIRNQDDVFYDKTVELSERIFY